MILTDFNMQRMILENNLVTATHVQTFRPCKYSNILETYKHTSSARSDTTSERAKLTTVLNEIGALHVLSGPGNG